MAKPKVPRSVSAIIGFPHLRHAGSACRVACSPDGRFIASVGFDKLLYLWCGQTGEVRQRIKVHKAPTNGLTVSPDGRTLAIRCPGTHQMWRFPLV